MRKKFVKVMLFGALVFSTAAFVGCQDYDDDINKLQEQVDALKSISISDLASQLQSLKDANGNLAVASAKMEAAIAEIKTNIEALKEVDKTLTSLVNGKVDQATYQAAIEGLNAKCSDLATKVAAISALEAAVNDLKANKADKVTMDALQAAIEALKAKDTELATQLASLKSTVEGLNSVLAGKADKATVDALKESIEALKISVNGIDAKIAKALEPMQAAIAKLQEDLAKKADAATIAADIAKVKADMTAVTDALKAETAANLAGVKAELAGRIAALETAKGQMEVQIGKLETDLKALKDRVAALESKPTTDLNDVKAAIEANKKAIEAAQTTIGGIQGTIKGISDRLDGIGTETGAVKNYIDNALGELNTTISGQITSSIAAAVASLQSEYAQADADLATRIGTLEGIDHVDQADYNQLKTDFTSLKNTVGDATKGLVKDLADLNNTVSNLISNALAAKGPGTIDAAIATQITATLENSKVIEAAIAKAISELTGRVDKIEADLDAVLQRIQSIVFVPQYKDGNGTTIVPVYTINNANGTVEMTFRIAPADKAAELAKLDPKYFSFYQEEELQSRATRETFTAIEVRAGVNAGTIVVKAQVSPNLAANTGGSYYPVALKLATSKNYGTEEAPNNKPVNDVTTEYFNVRVKDITSSIPNQTFNEDVEYIDVTEKAFDSFTVEATSSPSVLTLANCGFTQNLKLYRIECGAGNWIEVSSTKQADKDAIAAELKDKGFELVEGGVKLSSVNINKVGKVLNVQLIDNAIFGTTGTPAIPAKIFNATYTVTRNTVSATIDYAAITKAKLQSGSSTAFVVNAAGEFVWDGAASNAAQRFIIKAEKGTRFTDGLIAGATGKEILDAIKALNGVADHKIGNSPATASDPTFAFDVDNDKIIVTLPVNAARKTYNMSTVYKTSTYGDITLTATLKLAYPAATDLWTRNDIRWHDATTYFLGYTLKDIINGAINHDFAGYDYKYKTDVAYSYELVKPIDADGDGIADVTVSPVGKIVFAKYVNLNDLKIKFTAKIAGNEVASEIFNVDITYPITDKIASKNYTYTKTDLISGKKLNICTSFNLSDRLGQNGGTQVVKDGTILTFGKQTYAMVTGSTPAKAGQVVFTETDRVRYIVKDGKVDGSTQTVSAATYFDVTATGEFYLKTNINMTKKVFVEVQAAVDYTYGTVTSDVFTITLEPTK